MASMTNNWIWATWSPIADEAAAFWGVPLSAIDALSSIYFYGFLPFVFVAMYLIVDVLGLAKGLWLAFGLNAAGATLRWAGMSSYWCVYAGKCLCSYTQASILSIPPMIAGKWFGAHERTTATAIGVLSNQFGASLALGSTIFIDFFQPDGQMNGVVLGRYLFAQAFVATTSFVMLLIFLQNDEPPTPPSISEAMRRELPSKETSDRSLLTEQTRLLAFRNSSVDSEDSEENVSEEESRIVNNNDIVDDTGTNAPDATANQSFQTSLRLSIKYGWQFAFVYGLMVGTFYTVPPFFAQFESHWSPVESGWLGFLFQTTGVVGSYVTGRMVDKFQNHSFTMKALVLSAACFWACFGLFRASDQHWVVFVAVMGTGYCLAASSTLGFDVGAGMAYPANEATVGAVMQFVAQLYSFVAVTVGGWTTADTTFVTIVWCGIAIAGAILLSISTESRRPTE